MLELLRQQFEKNFRDNSAVFRGIQEGGPQRMALFRYRGLDMVMYVDEVNYHSVKKHIELVCARYNFPVCNCGVELPAQFKQGMKCFSCTVAR